MNSRKNNHVSLGLRCLLGETKRVAHKIGHVLDFRNLVIVGKDDGVELLFEHKDFPGQRIKLRSRHRFAHQKAIDVDRRKFRRIHHEVPYSVDPGESIGAP